jgi:signal transduction histidine kinase
MASPKSINVDSNIDENIFILGKEEKLYQAIYNIVDNAVKFTPENGKITLDLHKKNNQATIEIADTGIGIDPAQQKDIFNRFYRTEQNKNIAGHGLGLAITESIIKAHEGSIRVESNKGMGSTFIITLSLSS